MKLVITEKPSVAQMWEKTDLKASEEKLKELQRRLMIAVLRNADRAFRPIMVGELADI